MDNKHDILFRPIYACFPLNLKSITLIPFPAKLHLLLTYRPCTCHIMSARIRSTVHIIWHCETLKYLTNNYTSSLIFYLCHKIIRCSQFSLTYLSAWFSKTVRVYYLNENKLLSRRDFWISHNYVNRKKCKIFLHKK